MEESIAKTQQDKQAEDPQLKQQLLTLVSLQSKTLTYKDLYQLLKVQNAEQLEEVIIKAINLKLIKARIDQSEEKVVIAQGIGQEPDWQGLKKQVSDYKIKLGSLLESFESIAQF